MPTLCQHCNTDLDDVRDDMIEEDEEDVQEALKDCTLHDPAFDPTDYKTFPPGYMGTLIDRAKMIYGKE